MNERKLAVITPMVLLVIMIIFAQFFVVPRWVTLHQTEPTSWGPTVNGLMVLGYNYNKDLDETSVAFWNRGSQPITITGVTYDGAALTMGKVGSPNDLMVMGNTLIPDPIRMNATITPNELIFPASDHWNMFTYGPSIPMMEANGMATLYLGIGSAASGTTHVLVIQAGSQQYVFKLTG